MPSRDELIKHLDTLGKKEEFKQMIDLLPEELLDHSNDHLLIFLKGIGWQGIKEYDKAIACFNRAIDISDDNPFARDHRGQAWSEKQELHKAIEDYTRSIEIKDDMGIVLL